MKMALAEIIQSENPNESLVWTTNNPYLIYLDGLRADLNFRIAILEDQIDELSPSKSTAEKIKRRAKRIKDLAKHIHTESNFEDILKKDILRNAEASLALISFVFNKKSNTYTRSGKHFSVAKYLRNIFGLIPKESPYNIVLRLGRNLNHKDIDKYYELTHKMIRRSKDVYIKGLLSELELKVVPKTQKVLTDIVEEMCIPKEDLDFSIFLDQLDRGYSYYDHANRISSLDPNEILCYNEDGTEKIFEGNFLLEGTHERMHNLISKLSELSFPQIKGLSPPDESYTTLHMGLSEGISRRTEGFSLLFFFRKNKKVLGLTDHDIEIMEYSSKFDLIRRTNQTLYSIFKVMEYSESIKGFNAFKKLSEVSKIPLFHRDPGILSEFGLCESMYNLSTLLGSNYIKKCIQEINEEYGQELVERNMGLILRGFLTGHWQFPTHYRFLKEEYLPRAQKFFK